jgi:hypothetical protein
MPSRLTAGDPRETLLLAVDAFLEPGLSFPPYLRFLPLCDGISAPRNAILASMRAFLGSAYGRTWVEAPENARPSL